MKNFDIDTVLKDIDDLRDQFTNCRAYFPYMSMNHVGLSQISTAPYYISQGFKIQFNFSIPLTEYHIQKNNEIGHWINQSVIVRLYALMEYYGLVSNKIKIDQSEPGWKELDILRRLRQIFSHKSGKHDPRNNMEKKLIQQIISHFNMSISDHNDFPLNIDEVIDPIFSGCKTYVRSKLKNTD